MHVVSSESPMLVQLRNCLWDGDWNWDGFIRALTLELEKINSAHQNPYNISQ